VRLAPAGERATRGAMAATGEWLLLWLALAALTVSAPLRAMARRMWPELTLLLGLLGWQLVGPRVVVVFLLALGVTGRVLLLVHLAQAWWGGRARGKRAGAR
jgi:hypothetical protein